MKKLAAKKLFSLLLAITVALGVIPFTAVTRSKAANETYSTEDFEYVIRSDNTIRITKCINTTDEVITIPEEIDGYTVKSVFPDMSLFPSDNTTVKRLNIPKTVTSVATDSLTGDSLEFINVDKENLKYASDENGILYSKNYTELLFCPKGLQSDEIIIPDSVTGYNLYNNPFKECKKIKRIVFPKNATSVCYDFSNCTALESVEFPDSTVAARGKFNFYGCGSLKSIDFSNFTNCKLNYSAFQSCSSLEAVTLSPSITDIPDGTFYECSSLKSIDLLNSVSTIGIYAFVSCTSLSTVSGVENVQSVGASAFENCSSLTRISFGEKLSYIEAGAFRRCTSLSEISVPSSKIEIESSAFSGTPLVSDTSRYEDGGLYLGTNLISVLPDTSTFTVKSGTLSIGNSAFATQEKLTSVELPDSLQYIGGSSFIRCSALESIVIPDSVTEIGEYAFSFSGIKEIIIPDSVKSLGDFCFSESNLESITLPEKGIEFGSYCFNKTALKTVTLPTDIKVIVNGLFKSSSIENITVPESVTIIEADAFEACKNLEEICLPNVNEIRSHAFSGCTSLKEVSLGEGVKSIGTNAFANCPELSLITFNGSPESIASGAFSGCNKNMTVIGENGLGKDFAETNGFNYIPVSFDSEKKFLGFGGTLTIYKELPYSFIVDFVLKYSQAEYLHFEKLVFDGVIGDSISIDNADPSANYLTLNNLYVSLKSVDGEQISFAKMLEPLESGDYDAFKYVVKDDSGEQEEPSKPGDKNFFEKLGEQFDKIVTGALKTLSKVVNFFRKIFK